MDNFNLFFFVLPYMFETKSQADVGLVLIKKDFQVHNFMLKDHLTDIV